MCKSAVMNPWSGISWSNTIAPCDEDYFKHKYGSPKDYEAYINRNDFKKAAQKKVELTFDCLPEPFSGDKDSPVYCLNKNPGESVPAFHGNAAFERLTQENLNHSLKGPFWANKGKLTLPDGTIHGGVDWFEKRTKSLKLDLKGCTPNLFFVDYFPYHSKHGFSFPKDLPSNDYRNFLVEEAMRQNKIIIMMRQKKDWFKTIKGLISYPKLITLSCPAGGWLSEKNFIFGKAVTYNDLIKQLNNK